MESRVQVQLYIQMVPLSCIETCSLRLFHILQNTQRMFIWTYHFHSFICAYRTYRWLHSVITLLLCLTKRVEVAVEQVWACWIIFFGGIANIGWFLVQNRSFGDLDSYSGGNSSESEFCEFDSKVRYEHCIQFQHTWNGWTQNMHAFYY